jgi:hypothetical protein
VSGEPIARVRFLRRWNNLYPGDDAVFPLSSARNLVAQRYAEPLPPPVVAPPPTDPEPPPQRGPTQTVRK